MKQWNAASAQVEPRIIFRISSSPEHFRSVWCWTTLFLEGEVSKTQVRRGPSIFTETRLFYLGWKGLVFIRENLEWGGGGGGGNLPPSPLKWKALPRTDGPVLNLKLCGELFPGQAWIFYYSNILNWNQNFFHVPSCEQCKVNSETFDWKTTRENISSPPPPCPPSYWNIPPLSWSIPPLILEYPPTSWLGSNAYQL